MHLKGAVANVSHARELRRSSNANQRRRGGVMRVSNAPHVGSELRKTQSAVPTLVLLCVAQIRNSAIKKSHYDNAVVFIFPCK